MVRFITTEYREPRFYPFQELGGMYVHTNYDSFKSNMGSFGSVGSETSALINKAIAKQQAREKKIEADLKEIYGNDLTFKEILNFFIKPDGYFERVKEAFITAIDEEETDFVIKFTSWAKAQFDVGKDAAYRMEALLNPMLDSLNQINTKGYINKEALEKAVVSIKKSIGTLKAQGKDTGQGSIAKQVRGIKGFIWEVYAMRLFIEALRQFAISNKDFEITLQGRGVNADLVMDLRSIIIGINVKSASTNTFQGDYGISIFSNSNLQNIIDKMATYTASSSLEVFKYYVLNVSRMKASPLSGVKAQGLGHNQDGLNAIKSILGAYATMFIGEGNIDPTLGDIVQADILLTGDQIYLKSDVLRYLSTNQTEVDMESFLKITYNSSYDWQQFDRRKRQLMQWTSGRYDVVKNRAFMKGAVSDLLQQTASVKLRLLTKGII